MKLRPNIFLSGVSSEFASFRDAVEIEVEKKGCFAENQPIFAANYQTIEEILRRKISEADAVIHIVGFRFGFEPRDQPPDKPRRSYTQMEYDIARELQKPVYVFLSADANVCDARGDNEDPVATTLQLTYRKAIKSLNLFYVFKDKRELSRLAAEIPLIAAVDFRAEISRISKYAPAELVGRDDQLQCLDDAWLKVREDRSPRPQIISFIAPGGQGKTALVAKWVTRLAEQKWPDCDAAFAWSFYSGNTLAQFEVTSDLFLREALSFLGNAADKQFASSQASISDKGQRLAQIVGQKRCVLILDGLEPLQFPPTASTPSALKDAGLIALLEGLAAYNRGLCVITARYPLSELTKSFANANVNLPPLSRDAGTHLLQTLGLQRKASELETLVDDVNGHALTLRLLGAYLQHNADGEIRTDDLVPARAGGDEQDSAASRVLQVLDDLFASDSGLQQAWAIFKVLSLFDRPAEPNWIALVCQQPIIPGLTDLIVGKTALELCAEIAKIRPGIVDSVGGNWREGLDPTKQLSIHPSFAAYLRARLKSNLPEAWRTAHHRLCLFFTQKLSDDLKGVNDLETLQLAVYHGNQAGLVPSASLKDWILKIVRGKYVPDEQVSSPQISVFEKSPIRSVFVSYRRSGEASSLLASKIRGELRHRGCDVFLDVDSLRTGRFDDRLLNEIEKRSNFLVILSRDCLERVANPRDWFRRELACALSSKRNIIPVMMDGFSWPEPEQLPEDIRSAPRYNALKYTYEWLQALIDSIYEFLE